MVRIGTWKRTVFVAGAVGLLAGGLIARGEEPLSLEPKPQSVQPVAGQEQPFKLDQNAPAPQPAAPATPPTHHTWEMPPVTVVGQKSDLKEEDRIGSYQQPRWTADRRFPVTRTYVIPENKIEYEYWMRADIPRQGDTHLQQMHELEFGFPMRIQMDIYFVQNTYGTKGDITLDESLEFRYAFADWGKIYGNPAVYAEYTHTEEGPDAVEFKLLLADEIATRWHWGANLVWEHDTGGDFLNTYEATVGISYTAVDEKLSVGGEIKTALNTFHSDDGHDDSHEFYIGPSIQWRPIERMHVDLAPLIGLTGGSDAAQVFLVVGYEF